MASPKCFQEVADAIEFEALVSIFGGRIELVKIKINDFLGQAEENMRIMTENCHEGGNHDQFYQTAHSFKGVSAAMRIQYMAPKVKQLCDIARYHKEDIEEKKRLLAEIDIELKELAVWVAFVCGEGDDPVGGTQGFLDFWQMETDAFVQQIVKSAEPVDAPALIAATHSLKLNAGAANAQSLYNLALHLSFLAHHQPTKEDDMQELAEDIAAEFEEVKEEIEVMEDMWGGPEPLNLDALLAALMNKRDLATGVVEKFVKAGHQRLATIRTALSDQNSETISNEIKQLKADAGFMQAPVLSELAEAFSQQVEGEAEAYDKMEINLLAFSREFARFERFWALKKGAFAGGA